MGGKRSCSEAEVTAPPSKVSRLSTGEESEPSKLCQNEKVKNHYDSRKDRGLENRNKSPIFHLRNYNNWIKSVLIKKYIKEAKNNPDKARYDRDFFVLDLCCGKMGDALKWNIGRVDYVVGVDIATMSLRDGENRLRTGKNINFGATLISADCTVVDITRGFPNPKMLFDICSCQFALHYAFGTREHALTMLQNATRNLRRGGYFIGTIPNASVLLEKVKETNGKTWTGTDEISSVEFVEDCSSIQENSEFGVKYMFTLKDAVDRCPEFLIDISVLTQLCADLGLEKVEVKPFSEFKKDNENSKENMELWSRMKVPGLSSAEKEVIDLYQIFVFRKRDGPTRTDRFRYSRNRVEFISLEANS